MKTILLVHLSLFFSLGSLEAQTLIECFSSPCEEEVVTIKGSRANATVYYIDGLRVESNHELTAEVIDQEDGFPILFANVSLYRDEAFISGAVVDETGFFTIQGRVGDVVEVSHISYGKTSIPFEELITDPVVEIKEGMDLEEVVVLGYGVKSTLGCCDITCITSTVCFTSCKVEEHVEERTEEMKEEVTRAWSYFPNPTQENVFVQTGENKGDILLYSMEVRLIRQHTIGGSEELITLTGLPSATYLLVYNGGEKQEVIGQLVLID